MNAARPAAIRIAIAGAGLMGRWHACYARRLGAEIVAVADIDGDAARALAGRHGATAYANVDDMLIASGANVLHVCTPLSSHFPLSLRALDAGMHVLAEKPLTVTAEQTRTLLAHAEQHGLLACPVHQFGFQRGVLKARKMLAELGEVLHAQFNFCSAGGGAQTGAALDAIVADIVPHPLAILQALWPEQILQADAWQANRPRHGELHARGALESIAVNLYVSMHARPTRCDLEIYCRQGSLHLNFFHGYAVVHRGAPSRADKIAQPFLQAGKSLAVAGLNLAGRALRREGAYPGLTELIRQFYGAVQGQGEMPITPAQTLAVADIRERLMRQAMPEVLTDGAA